MMDIAKQPKLVFHGVNILKVDFSSTAPRGKNVKININCIPKVYYPKDKPHLFNIIMDVTLECPGCFDLRVLGVGNFELTTDITDEIKKTFVNSNSVAIMFPYIRAFITTFTANLGNTTSALTIPTQFFKGEVEEVFEDS